MSLRHTERLKLAGLVNDDCDLPPQTEHLIHREEEQVGIGHSSVPEEGPVNHTRMHSTGAEAIRCRSNSQHAKSVPLEKRKTQGTSIEAKHSGVISSSNRSPSSPTNQGVPTEPSSNEDAPSLVTASLTPELPRYATLELFRPWMPQADPYERANTFKTWRSKRETVLLSEAVIAVIIFLINLIFTVVFKVKWGSHRADINAFYTGSCSEAERISTGIHLAINVLSTLLLGASNMCMQLLAAPTRSEVNKAHKDFYWLDVGVPSIRNLKYISRERLIVWGVLGLSSVPLHFLSVNYNFRATHRSSRRFADYRRYNSAVFPTLASNSFDWVAVTPSFAEGAPWSVKATQDTLKSRGHELVLGLVHDIGTPVLQPLNLSIGNYALPTSDQISLLQKTAVTNSTAFTNLTKIDCFRQYSSAFGDRSDVLLVVPTPNINNTRNSLLAYGNQNMIDTAPYEWLCKNSNTFSCKKIAANGYEDTSSEVAALQHWNIYGYEIGYCMASYRETDSRCSVVFSFRIMIGKMNFWLLGSKPALD